LSLAPASPGDDECGCGPLGDHVWRHYTDEAGYNGILSSQSIKVSDASVDPIHARHGTGVYVTNLVSEDFRIGQAAKLFWNMPFYTAKLTHYIDIDTTGLEVLATDKPYIYRILADPPSLDLSGRIVGGGEAQWKC